MKHYNPWDRNFRNSRDFKISRNRYEDKRLRKLRPELRIRLENKSEVNSIYSVRLSRPLP